MTSLVLDYIFAQIIKLLGFLIPTLGTIILFQIDEYLFKRLHKKLQYENASCLITMRILHVVVLASITISMGCTIWDVLYSGVITDMVAIVILVAVFINFFMSFRMVLRLVKHNSGFLFAVSPILNIALYLFYMYLIYMIQGRTV